MRRTGMSVALLVWGFCDIAVAIRRVKVGRHSGLLHVGGAATPFDPAVGAKGAGSFDDTVRELYDFVVRDEVRSCFRHYIKTALYIQASCIKTRKCRTAAGASRLAFACCVRIELSM